ncbi:MAG: hypothetical protein D3924_08970, partial [Candidatus Electrothrix sp. AR4]|nr:hypothetical protein [Candidatus Electrothrix sp. AR4]
LKNNAGEIIAYDITDENGNYAFTGLASGDYTVEVTDTRNVLGQFSQSGDPDATLDGGHTLTTTAGTDYLDVDFGYVPSGHTSGKGLIGDTIFLDLNNSGTVDVGEGLEGVTVQLYDSSGVTLLGSTTTNSDGTYSFGNLDPTATYTVKVDPTTLPNTGTGLTNSVDPDGGSASESSVDLSASGGISLTQDFGYVSTTPNSLSGTLWDDTNANGTLDASETVRLDGVTVVLRDSDGNTVGIAVTDVNGDYSFGNLPDDTYTIDVIDSIGELAGWWHSLGGSPGTDSNSQVDPYTVPLSGGSDNTTGDFGYYRNSASIGDLVWNDSNGDGLNNNGELGLVGYQVTLTITYPNGETVTLVTVTDANGAYSFDNLLTDEDYNGDGAGQPTYLITVMAPVDMLSTHTGVTDGNDSDNEADNPSGEPAIPVLGINDTTNDFGFVADGEIGDLIWNDQNGDGIQDAGETGIDGVTIDLYQDANGNGVIDVGEPVLSTTTTAGGGAYDFIDLPPGDYLVDVTDTGSVLSGFNLTGGTDPVAVTGLTAGQDYNDADFGYQQADASIGDLIWNDQNGDGIQDAGESGIDGVTVDLYQDTNGNGVIDAGDINLGEQTTAGGGAYDFTGLVPGDYLVDVTDTGSVLSDFNLTGGTDPAVVTNLTAGQDTTMQTLATNRQMPVSVI